MKYNKYLIVTFFILNIFLFISCNKKEPWMDSYRLYQQQIIETYDSNVNKEDINYEYDFINDRFWKQATHNDINGNILKIEINDFDKFRIPSKIITSSGSTIIKVNFIKYFIPTFDIISNEEFLKKDDNKHLIHSEKNIFDNDGFIISKELINYSPDSNYKNVEGSSVLEYKLIRYFPVKSAILKGDLNSFYFIEKYKKFNVKNELDSNILEKKGELAFEEFTEFDKQGYPKHKKYKNFFTDTAYTNEWFDIKLDSIKRIKYLNTFFDKKLNILNNKCKRTIFKYFNDGFLKEVDTYVYTPEKESYNKYIESYEYKWVKSEIMSKQNYNDVSVIHESYDSITTMHYIDERRITKMDNFGEKITEFYEQKFETGKKQGNKPFLKKRIIDKYWLYEKNEKSIGEIKKNKLK